jgi:hypothetical protein
MEGIPVIWRTLETYQWVDGRHALSVEEIGSLRAFGHVTGIAGQDDQRVLKIRASGTFAGKARGPSAIDEQASC